MALLSSSINLALKSFGKLPLSTARSVGSGLGALAWLLAPRARETTRTNLRACFPDMDPGQREALAKLSLRHTVMAAFEAPRIWTLSKHRLRDYVLAVEGIDLVERACAAQKGLIVLGPHYGNWEFLGKLLPDYGPVTSLYQPLRFASLDSFVKRARELSGARLVPTDRRGVLALLRCLKNGEITGILPDQVPDQGSGAHADFFGICTYTQTLAHGLINKTGCTALLATAERCSGGFRLVFLEPDPRIYAEDKAESLRGLNASIEQLVLRKPEQYQWEYKRFKRQPKDCATAVPYHR